MAKRETAFKPGDMVRLNKTYVGADGHRYPTCEFPVKDRTLEDRIYGNRLDLINPGETFTVIKTETVTGRRPFVAGFHVITARGIIGWLNVINTHLDSGWFRRVSV